jgi:hypothetical protein
MKSELDALHFANEAAAIAYGRCARRSGKIGESAKTLDALAATSYRLNFASPRQRCLPLAQ